MSILVHHPMIAYIRSCTQNYAAYLKWRPERLDQWEARSKFMASLRRDWETVATFYRMGRRKGVVR